MDKGRQELERFVAAAIAFCFRYDRLYFQPHFWRTICKLGDDPDMPHEPRIQLEVSIGERRQADVIIMTEKPRPAIHVIECKIYARLALHQNPENRAFWKKDGYGTRIAKLRKDAQLRYIILGMEGEENQETKRTRNILYARRRWSDLANGCPEDTPLVKDLTESLGMMGIPGFRMKRAKGFRFAGQLADVGMAFEVIKAVMDELELAYTDCEFDGSDGGDGGEPNFGLFIRKIGDGRSKKHSLAKLNELGSANGWAKAWLGYVVRKDKRLTRSVYLYPNKKDRAKDLAQALRAVEELRKFKLEAAVDEPLGPCIIIDDSPEAARKDVDWFTSVIRKVALVNWEIVSR